MSNTSNRGGRPRKEPDEKRNIPQSVHLNQREKEEIERRAERAGLAVSEYIRKRALGRPVKTKVEEKTIREVQRIGVNINQLARWANRGEDEKVRSQIEDAIKELKSAIERLGR